jgi:hypothetical protein
LWYAGSAESGLHGARLVICGADADTRGDAQSRRASTLRAGDRTGSTRRSGSLLHNSGAARVDLVGSVRAA